MDILDSVLRICNAEPYLVNLKNYGVDAFTLKILNDEDLQIIGIDNPETRELILKRAENLQIPSEKYEKPAIDKEYIKLVLNQISVQLVKHLATLSIAVKRKDLVICDLMLAPAAETLHTSIITFKNQMDEFEEKVLCQKKNKAARYKLVLIPSVIALLLVGSYKVHSLISN